VDMYCPKCGGGVSVDEGDLRREMECPHCQARFVPAQRQAMVDSPTGALPVTVGGCLSDGWEAFKTYPWVLIGGTVLYAILWGAMTGATRGGTAGRGTGSLLFMIFGGPLVAGYCWLTLKAVRRENPTIGDLFVGFSRFGPVLLVFVFCGGVVLLGTVCFIIPGIVLALMFALVFYLVMDKQLAGWDAIKLSAELMRGHKLTVFLLWSILGLLNAAGSMVFLIGILVTLPIAGCSAAAVYRRINGR
jgi:hypothetical protein